MATGVAPLVKTNACGNQPVIEVSRAFRIQAANETAAAGESARTKRAATEREHFPRFALIEPRIRTGFPIKKAECSAERRVCAPPQSRR